LSITVDRFTARLGRNVFCEEPLSEISEGDPRRFSVTLLDLTEAVAELALGLPFRPPVNLTAKRFHHLAAVRVRVLDSPNGPALPAVLEERGYVSLERRYAFA
jgi:hypothetical protein